MDHARINSKIKELEKRAEKEIEKNEIPESLSPEIHFFISDKSILDQEEDFVTEDGFFLMPRSIRWKGQDILILGRDINLYNNGDLTDEEKTELLDSYL